jgi:hypothetical protein
MNIFIKVETLYILQGKTFADERESSSCSETSLPMRCFISESQASTVLSFLKIKRSKAWCGGAHL